jgi:hypothetical protein
MKKIVYLLIGIAFVASSCKKDEEAPEIITVSTEHKSLLIDFTATWCCPCGGSLPIFKDIQRKYPYKVVPLGLHAQNDSFFSPQMFYYWSGLYNVTGIPTYVGDNQEVIWGYPNMQLDTSHFYRIIKETISQNVPDCGIGISKSIAGNKMTVKTKTAFFKNVSGKFNLAIYITEDGLYFDQQCSEEDIHDHVFRASLTDPQGKGMTIATGSVEKGKTFDNSFVYDIPAAYVKNNLHIIAVVYEFGTDGKPKRIVNVNKI